MEQGSQVLAVAAVWLRKYWAAVALAVLLLAAGLLTMSALLGSQVRQTFTEIAAGLDDGAFPAAESMPPGMALGELETAEGVAGDAAGRAVAPAPQALAQADQQQGQQQDQQRMIVKTADVTLEVDDVPAAEARLTALAEQMGGYVVSARTQGSGERQRSWVTFRVPAERFDETLTGAEALANRVLARTVSGDDVTEEFVDLQARLRNLEATNARLLDLLAKADEVSDALEVSYALTDIQGQIEQVRGRMEYLQKSAALSTITVQLQTEPVIVVDDGWQPLAVAQGAFDALVGLVQTMLSVVIILLVWIPVWGPLLFLVFWYRRRQRATRE